MTERVQKILAQWGIASRRHAETLIREGRVKLNGQVVTLGDQADPKRDRIEVNGKVVRYRDRPELLYLLVHKPTGLLSTCFDPQGRSTVLDLLPSNLTKGTGLHPVGRLDRDSSGALLLTNDGDLTLQLTHPRYHLPKTYQVWIKGNPSEEDLQQWREGVMLMGKKTLPAEIRVMAQRPDRALLRVILTEGKNRQIRRVAEALGFEVLRLHRLAIGSIQLQPPREAELPKGGYRFLTVPEISFLRSQAHLKIESLAKTR